MTEEIAKYSKRQSSDDWIGLDNEMSTSWFWLYTIPEVYLPPKFQPSLSPRHRESKFSEIVTDVEHILPF